VVAARVALLPHAAVGLAPVAQRPLDQVAQDEPGRPADAADALVLGLQAGHDQPVLEAGAQLHGDVDRAVDRLGHPHDRMRRAQPDRVAAGARLQRERIGDAQRRTVGGAVLGLQHHRPFQVAPRRPARSRRAHRRVAGVGVEQAAQDARGVEPGWRPPVDRPVRADEGRRLRVAEKGVAGQVGHLGALTRAGVRQVGLGVRSMGAGPVASP
jgi:hypothetical protein